MYVYDDLTFLDEEESEYNSRKVGSVSKPLALHPHNQTTKNKSKQVSLNWTQWS